MLRSVRINVESELRCDHHLISKRLESFADHFFVRERPVNLCRIKERHALIDGRTNQYDRVIPFNRGS